MIQIYDWKKKVRTMLRFIKPGDFFAFEAKGGLFCFGRIMSKVDIGHVAELFSQSSDEPNITAKQVESFTRAARPVILDSYSLFDKKLVGDWRIIGHQSEYSPDPEGIYFTYKSGSQHKRVDIFGDEKNIDSAMAKALPKYSPQEDWDIKELLLPLVRST